VWIAFELGDLPTETLLGTALPIGIGACIVWLAAVTTWMLPLWSAVNTRRRGERVNKELAARAYRITLKGPVRVLLLRTGLWAGAACLTGVFLTSTRPVRGRRTTAVAALHAYVVSCLVPCGGRGSSPRCAAAVRAGSPLRG
jgi:hypothetical protein